MIDATASALSARVFTEGEIAYCQRKRDFASSFAARFAAKEAAMKALGHRALTRRLLDRHRGRSTSRSTRAFPFTARRETPSQSMGATQPSMLTLTHSRDLAIAHVILTREE
jgi:holo-[acyl-carrier protein] synthase